MIFKEYGVINKNDIPQKAFDDLKNFASYEENYRYLDVVHGGNALRLKNYVGTIVTKDGTIIEILPKIYASEDDVAKKTLLKMLKTLKKSPFKNINKASLQVSNITIFEIFISMFLEELNTLVKKGIKADYIGSVDNLYFLKGKMKLNEQIRHNLLHKEKFFVEFDEYTKNRVENKLIKTTLEKLYKLSTISTNQQRLREFIFIFDDVDTSHNIKNDFKKCKNDRSMQYYQEILRWCSIFLNNDSFSPYRGDDVAYALLFDMNILFESYVAHFFKKNYQDRDVKTQDKQHKLVESHSLFQLKPDIVIDDNIILDTKWKLINQENKTYDVSQADLYQMYVYGKKYNANDIYLIYPKSEDFQSSLDVTLAYDKSLNIHILCFDCVKNYLDFKGDF